MEMPSKEEMAERIAEHRALRNDSPIVNVLWKGYLTALYEWEFLSEDDYQNLVALVETGPGAEINGKLLKFPQETKGGLRLPTTDELLKSMTDSVNLNGNTDAINLLWRGYLAALMEWAHLYADDYHELNGRLKDIGQDERREIFTGVNPE